MEAGHEKSRIPTTACLAAAVYCFFFRGEWMDGLIIGDVEDGFFFGRERIGQCSG